ncbi:unnamed protein product, partial [Heligmosomoides polygyrus]|uniref:DUF1330 domain-containing protein n=1 Tax=Heligmosomoides polygyrus TaxID=6339 RepID=A0A183GWV3_HELPZ
MDSRVLKMWNEVSGKPFAAIETESALNDFCRYPESGLIFLANEAPRMQQYFVPALGTAPKWCSYLEAITEELEESKSAALYDDYKFVTKEELDQLSLSHLIGSSVLRAY